MALPINLIIFFAAPPPSLYISLLQTGRRHFCINFSEEKVQPHVLSKTATTIVSKLIYVIDQDTKQSFFSDCHKFGMFLFNCSFMFVCVGPCSLTSRAGHPSTRTRVRIHSQILLTYKPVIYLNLALVFRDLFGSLKNAMALPQECFQRPIEPIELCHLR